MTPTQARALAAALVAAANKADAAGAPQIDMLAELRARDDTARADLEQAIQAAQLPVQG